MILEKTVNGIGTAKIEPRGKIKARDWGVWQIEYTVGSKGIAIGGGIRITIPHGFSVPQIVYRAGDGYVTASCSRKDVRLEIIMNEELPSSKKGYYGVDWVTYHGKNFTVRVREGCLVKSNKIMISYGIRDFSQGCQAQHFSATVEFTVAVDFDGKGSAPYTGFYRLRDQPILEVVGRKINKFNVVTPSIVRPGERFSVLVTPVDSYINVASNYTGEIHFKSTSRKATLPEKHHFTKKHSTGKWFKGIQLRSKKRQFIEIVDDENYICSKSNPIKIAESKKRIFWGDIHGHTSYSDGYGTPEEFYEFARNIAGLDFAAITDHDYAGTYLSDKEWENICNETEKQNVPGKFVTILGYEFSDRKFGGDRNVYYLYDDEPIFRNADPEGSYQLSPKDLWKKLEGKKAITVPHHSVSLHCSTDRVWNYYNDKREPVVEIYSSWGNSEKIDCARSLLLPSKYTKERTVQGALEKGCRFGFIASSDDHAGHPGFTDWLRHRITYGNGLVAVNCDFLDRKSIFEAIKNRNCYATTGARIILEVQINGASMGTELEIDESEWKSGSRQIRLRAIGEKKIKRIDIVRNNKDIFAHQGTSEIEELSYKDTDRLSDVSFSPTNYLPKPFTFYYIRVTEVDSAMAWSSPIWVTLYEPKM